jgi:hypothetical protein
MRWWASRIWHGWGGKAGAERRAKHRPHPAVIGFWVLVIVVAIFIAVFGGAGDGHPEAEPTGTVQQSSPYSEAERPSSPYETPREQVDREYEQREKEEAHLHEVEQNEALGKVAREVEKQR